MELPITSIIVGERSRREMRNIDSLAASIRARGCLHPPVVRRDGDRYVLVAGARRLAAMQSMGWAKVTVTVTYNIADEVAALHAEGEENTEREPFTPSEAVAHAERIEALIAAAAKERQGARTDLGLCAESAQSPDDGKTRTAVAKATGLGRTKLAEAREVVAAAADDTLPAEVRQAAARAVKEMDATGNVHGAHRKVEQAKARIVIAAEEADTRRVLDEMAAAAGYNPTPAEVARMGRANKVVGNVLSAVIDMCETVASYPVEVAAEFADDVSFPRHDEITTCINWLAGLAALTERRAA